MIILLTSCASKIALDCFNKLIEISHAVIVLASNVQEISNIDRIETTRINKCVIPIVLDHSKNQRAAQRLFSVLPPPDHIVQIGNEENNNNLVTDILEKELRTFGKQEVSSPSELAMKVKQAGINRVVFTVNPDATSSDSDLKSKLRRFVRTGSLRRPKPKREPIDEDTRDMLNQLSEILNELHCKYFHKLFLTEEENNQKVKSDVKRLDNIQSVRRHKSEKSQDAVVEFKDERKVQLKEDAKKILEDQQEDIYSNLVEEQVKSLLEFKRKHKSYKS